jgi:hypothetical protein
MDLSLQKIVGHAHKRENYSPFDCASTTCHDNSVESKEAKQTQQKRPLIEKKMS